MLTCGRHGVYLPFFPALLLSCVRLAFNVSLSYLKALAVDYLTSGAGPRRFDAGQSSLRRVRGDEFPIGVFWVFLSTFCSIFVLEGIIKDTIYTFMLRIIEIFRKHGRLGKFSRARRGSVDEREREPWPPSLRRS